MGTKTVCIYDFYICIYSNLLISMEISLQGVTFVNIIFNAYYYKIIIKLIKIRIMKITILNY